MKPSVLLFPKRCMLCRSYLSGEQNGLCDTCRIRMEQDMPQIWRAPPEYLETLVCAARYGGRVRRAVLDVKMNGKRANIIPMAQLMMKAWEIHKMPMPDLITCVPASPIHARVRGFNPSEGLARAIAQQWDVPFEETLRHRVFSRKQSKLHAPQRWKNAKRAFSPYTLFGRYGVDLSGKRVLLVDDIVTTGATVSVCAGLLRQMGAACVEGLVLATSGEKK